MQYDDAGEHKSRQHQAELFQLNILFIGKNTLVGQNLHNCSTYHIMREKVCGTPPSERTVVKATEARVQQEHVRGLERQSVEGEAVVAVTGFTLMGDLKSMHL